MHPFLLFYDSHCIRCDPPRRSGRQNESDPSKIQALYKEAVDDLAVLKRSALVNQVYGGWKLAIERQPEDPAVARERSDS